MADAAVALGLIPGDQLPEIATTGLIEGYDCKSLLALAGESTAYYDPVECQRLWTAALEELGLEIPEQIERRRASSPMVATSGHSRLCSRM